MKRFVLLILLLIFVECQGKRTPKSLLIKDIVLEKVEPDTIRENTIVYITGENFLDPEIADYFWIFADLRGNQLAQGKLLFVSKKLLKFVVNNELLSVVKKSGKANGLLFVKRVIKEDNSSSTASLKITFFYLKEPVPELLPLGQNEFFLNSEIKIDGENFLQAQEGTTLIEFDGEFIFSSFPGSKIVKPQIPLEYITRKEAKLLLTPDIFGIRPGEFKGKLRIVNILDDKKFFSSWIEATIVLKSTIITSIEPTEVRRGQIINIKGNGFVETDFALEVTTLVVLEGDFVTKDGKTVGFHDENAMILYPDEVTDSTLMKYVLRVTLNINGELDGLGLTPGVFNGKIYPVLISGLDEVSGQGKDVTIKILPQLQIVYLKFLPDFYNGIEKFGMLNVVDRLKEQILKRINKDYEGINIKFVTKRPEDFVDYSIIEIMGRDPNGAGLLGLDNTEGKDVGNLRFNDVIGGVNAAVEEQGYFAYGGVFVESFLQFSPEFAPSGFQEMATELFDDAFSEFIPELGGDPVKKGEYPGGERDKKIEYAIYCLGNMIGNTISHEIGHSLGLAAIEGHYHNIGDNPGWIMDAGNYRSFEERAGINGKGPEVFSPFNRAYLEEILPVE